jgi:hypothetical protein
LDTRRKEVGKSLSQQQCLIQIRLFGKPGTLYDYTGVDIPQSKEKAKELEELQKGMKKKINPKVMNMIDTSVSLFLNIVLGTQPQQGREEGS